MADIRQKAVATANAYDQGNIAGLDDAMTRRLIASTVLTESHGGDLAVTNKQGYVGRYQAGAGWLADAGYVKADKLKDAMADAGFKSEWAWAKSGGMTKFLQDPSNWNNGLTLEKYKASDDIQDRAFKINCDKSYERAVKAGVLDDDSSPQKVAGFLKARHISGYGGAVAAATGGRVYRDSNGTSNYDYMHDITRNRDGLNQHMTTGAKTQTGDANPQPAKPAAASADGQLKQGESGPEIEKLQQRLNKLGYKGADGKPLAEDGDFGDNTRAAVVKFQQEHGLQGLGVVGPKTLAALDAAEKAQTQTAPANTQPGTQPATQTQGAVTLNAAYDMSLQYDNVKYGFGSKNLASGKVDCSGWVSQLQNATMDEINKEAGKTVFSGKDYFSVKGQTAADIISDSVKTTGTLMRSPLDKSQLKEGMIIGEDNGQKGWDKGRYNGIDHITMIVKDPKTGELMVSQSRGGEGVELTTLDKYLQHKQSRNVELFATDPLAKARPLIEGTQPAPVKSAESLQQGDKPLMSNPNHPDHRLYKQAVSNLEQLGPSGGFQSRADLEKAAAAVAADAKGAGMNDITHVSRTQAPNGQNFLVAVQGDPTNPASKIASTEFGRAVSQSIEQSSQAANAVKPATDAAQLAQEQSRQQSGAR